MAAIEALVAAIEALEESMPPAKKYPPAGGWPSDNCVPSPPPRESLDIKLEVGVTARSGKPADGAHITIDLAAGSSTEVKEEHTEPRPPAATRKRKAPVALTPPDEHVWLPVGGGLCQSASMQEM